VAKSNFVERGEITEVFYNFGKFNNDQRPKFLRAPFCFVKLDGIDYVMPTAVGVTAADINGVINSDVFDTEQYMGRGDFGFVNGDRLYINENQMGDMSDNPIGMHKFGFI
jgi:hypothetical protein